MVKNKNNQTTSTKCQYQAAASKPKCWFLVKTQVDRMSVKGKSIVLKVGIVIKCLTKQNNKNNAPTVTWNPWNPVVTKNELPYTFSFHVKVIPYLYSTHWQNKNVTPNIIVTTKCLAKFSWPVKFDAFKIAWCAKVIVTPEVNNNKVLIKGNPIISKGWILNGGQTQPKAIDGDKLKWKKPQKNAKKNITSETINNAIP